MIIRNENISQIVFGSGVINMSLASCNTPERNTVRISDGESAEIVDLIFFDEKSIPPTIEFLQKIEKNIIAMKEELLKQQTEVATIESVEEVQKPKKVRKEKASKKIK